MAHDPSNRISNVNLIINELDRCVAKLSTGVTLPPPRTHKTLIFGDAKLRVQSVHQGRHDSSITKSIIEIVDEDDERDPSDSVPCDPIWLHRGTDVNDVGDQTLNLVRSIAVPPTAYWWLAGEREAIRSVRDVLVHDRSVPQDRISTAAYWRIVPLDPRQR